MKHPCTSRRAALAVGALALAAPLAACSSTPHQSVLTEGGPPTTTTAPPPAAVPPPAGAAEAALDATDRTQPIATSDETFEGAPSWKLYESTHDGEGGERLRCITLEAPAPDPEIPTGTDPSGVPLSIGTPEASAVSCTPVDQTSQSATLVVPTSGEAYLFSVSTAPVSRTPLKLAHNDGSTVSTALSYDRATTPSGSRWVAVQTVPLEGPDDSIEVVG